MTQWTGAFHLTSALACQHTTRYRDANRCDTEVLTKTGCAGVQTVHDAVDRGFSPDQWVSLPTDHPLFHFLTKRTGQELDGPLTKWLIDKRGHIQVFQTCLLLKTYKPK
jgi:hypothetical protein